jgi:transcriptional regulator with XRE-family HTH domain
MSEISTSVDLMVGRRLRARRRLLGFTQQDLGQACGVTFQQIHKYESATCRLSVVMLWKLAKMLEVEMGYFFTSLTDDEAVIVRRHDMARPREVSGAT